MARPLPPKPEATDPRIKASSNDKSSQRGRWLFSRREQTAAFAKRKPAACSPCGNLGFRSVYAPFEGTQRSRRWRQLTTGARYHGLESANLDCTKDAQACLFAKWQTPGGSCPFPEKTKASNRVGLRAHAAPKGPAPKTARPTNTELARPTFPVV